MRVDTLPSPGLLMMGLRLRTVMAQAISSVETQAFLRKSGTVQTANTLTDFLNFAVTSIAAYRDVTVPTVSSRAILASAPNKLFITCSEALDAAFVPPASAFTIADVTKVVSKVEINGPVIVLTVSAPWAAGNVSTVAYTQPAAALRARDRGGNLLATFTAAAIVNGVV